MTALLRARFQAAAKGVIGVGVRGTFDRAVAKERARERFDKTVSRMPHRRPTRLFLLSARRSPSFFVVLSSFPLFPFSASRKKNEES